MKKLVIPAVAAMALAGCSEATPVAITNSSITPIENVSVFGSGFDQRVGSIAAGQTVTVQLRPEGESGLGLAFRSGSRHFRTPPQGYFEGGGAYKVKVVVAPDLTATVDGELKY